MQSAHLHMKLQINRKLRNIILSLFAALSAYTQTSLAQDITYAGGTTQWGVNEPSFDSTYTDAMNVTVEGDSTITLISNVTPASFNINTGVNVTVDSEAGENNTLEGALNIADGASLTIQDGARITNSTQIAGTGTFAYSSTQDQTNLSSAFTNFAGDLILNQANVRFEAVPANLDTITLNEGSFLRLHENVNIAAGTEIAMNGSSDASGPRAVISFSTGTGIQALVTTSGHVELSTTYNTGTLYAGLAGSGTVRKTGNDSLTILGDSTHTGTLMLTAGTTNIGNTDGTPETVDFTVIDVASSASLNFYNATVDAATRITGTGNVSLDINSEDNFATSRFLSEFQGNVYIYSGVRFAGGSLINADATLIVAAGNRLRFDGVGTAADIILNGATTEGGARASLSAGNYSTISGMVTTTGEVSIDPSWRTITLTGGLDGSGNLYKTGSDVAYLHANSSHTGNLILEAGTFQIGNGSGSQVSVDFRNIVVKNNTKLTINTANNAGLGDTVITLQGGTMHLHDTTRYESSGVVDYSKAISIGKIDVEQNSQFTNEWKGLFQVAELTGTANLTFGGTKIEEQLIVAVTSIKDYNGTVDVGSNALQDLEIGSIDQAAGMSVTLKGDADGIDAQSGLIKKGAGTATIQSTLAVTGGDLDVQGGSLILEAATTVDGAVKGAAGSTITLASDAASLSIVGADYSLTGTAGGGSITAHEGYSLTSTEIAHASLVGVNLSVADNTSLALNNVTLDASSSITLGAGSSVSVANSKLTSLSVAKNAALIDFTTGQGTQATDVQSYTITGVYDILNGSAATGSLTLDLGPIGDFTDPADSGDIVAFILGDSEITALSTILEGGDYDHITLLIGGKSYDVLGSVMYPDSSGQVLLYIPEPSTATLSLLALAGLLARRRRSVEKG